MSASFTTSSKLSWVNTRVASGGGVQLGSEISLTLATIAEAQFNKPVSMHFIIPVACETQEFGIRESEQQARCWTNAYTSSLHKNTFLIKLLYALFPWWNCQEGLLFTPQSRAQTVLNSTELHLKTDRKGIFPLWLEVGVLIKQYKWVSI